MKVKRSRDELVAEFQVQVRLLRKAASEFDAGDEEEVRHLAMILRVLLHNTKDSKSLLQQLGVQHQLKFLDTSAPAPKGTGGGTLINVWTAGLARIQLSSEGVRYSAPLNDALTREDIRGPRLFKEWWNEWVIQDTARQRFTRKELVLFVANQGGGGHVDPAIASRWHALTKLNSLGWGSGVDDEGNPYVGVPAGPTLQPMGNPIPVNIRQITWEVDRSLVTHISGLLPAAPTSSVRETGGV